MRWLKRRPAAPDWVERSCGDYFLPVVGESNYQAELVRQRTNAAKDVIRVLLVPEPRNPFDSNAVLVRAERGGPVGYLPRDIAAQLQRPLVTFAAKHRCPVACLGRLYGGDESRPHIGLWLDLDVPSLGLLELRIGDRNYEWSSQATTRDD